MLTDNDLPALARTLGIPGFVDIHTHFMPKQVLDRVWAYFDRAGTGHRWPIQYRLDEHARVETLRALGVVRFTSLNYAHRPDMAAWLNSWSASFAAAHTDCAHSATFYPEDGAGAYVEEALTAGAAVFKVHLVVGNFDPWHERLRPVWAQIEAAQVPVVIHAGEFPNPTRWTGAGRLRDVLVAHPELRLVIAHLGARDYLELWDLGIRYPNVMWDTTMSFTDFFLQDRPVPNALVENVIEHPERIILGSDYPNIPHAYAHQIEALQRLGVDENWLRAVLYENGARLLGHDQSKGVAR
ncbi:MAG: amidohydrolase family protein [Acidimicrobiia bacterium]|nr:amidohydrolase family protein [Acidimicrobiia bacterium]